jgi:hypothetical protein
MVHPPFWVKELATALVISKEYAKMDGLHILYYINVILKNMGRQEE